ncbi:hypothetical protein I4U23_022474 [Adineta vaga]|nr:hypothetical protein I4U23_022474 [Adineta vaga]
MSRATYKPSTVDTLRDLGKLSDRFNELCRSDLSNNNKMQLFCRQLKRLMDNNVLGSYHFWFDIYHYLIYVLDESNSTEIWNYERNRFCSRIKFEIELEQRQEQFQQSLLDKSSVFSTDTKLKKPINSSPNKFLTSAQPNLKTETTIFRIKDVLDNERWIVILCDPGNGKTTLLRSIMRIYIDALYHKNEKASLGERTHAIFRIPLLIQICEFASWLKYNSTKKLIDYIGENTQFSKKFRRNHGENVFKELIEHGHALILLDGLDKIVEVKGREKIVELIREFIYEYVKDPNFISAFDEKLFDFFEPRFHVYETQPPSKDGGNQIIITSRIIGYDLNSLTGTFIKHYLLSPMSQDEAGKFAENWMSEVEQVVHKVLLRKRLRINNETIKNLSHKRTEAVKSMFEKDDKSSYLNSSLLTYICTIIFQSSDQCQSRVETFKYVIESAIRSLTKNEPTISYELLNQFLINLSTYLHLKSSSNLIDTFDITRLARLTVKQQNITNHGAKLREYTDKLLELLNSDLGLVAERDLDVFAFRHSSFQEYFIAQFLVERHFNDQNIRKDYSIEEIANRFILNAINPRFRQAFLIALNMINSNWSFNDFDQFCTVFVTSNKNYSIPLGALFLLDAINYIQRLPSLSIIFTALNSLLDHPLNMVTEQCLIPNLMKLPVDTIQKWMSSYLKDDKSLSKFCQCLLMEFQHGLKNELINEEHPKLKSSAIFKQLYVFYNESISAKFVVDQTSRRIMMLKRVPNDIFPHQGPSCFADQKIDVSTIHPLILSILIVICGGVIWIPDKRSIKIYWSYKEIHYQSSIIEPIIKYLMNEKQSHLIKVQTLIEQYGRVIKEKASPSNTSDDIVDTLVALICLHEVSNLFIIEKYHKYQALPIAFEKIKQAYFFITKMFYEEYYNSRDRVEILFKDQVELIIKSFKLHFHQDNSEYLANSTIDNVAFEKLFIQWSVESFSSWDIYRDGDDNLESQQEVYQLYEENSQAVQEDLQGDFSSFLLTFVPLSLQKLYYCLFINPSDKTDSLPFVVFLAQCLTYLENVSETQPNFTSVLIKLISQCKEHMLENYISALLVKTNLTKELIKATDELILSESKCTNQYDNWNELIDMECQRISEAKDIKQNEEKDRRLFAALICLAQLIQVRYYSVSNDSKTNHTFSSSSSSSLSEKISNAIIDIDNSILRIIALDMILEMKNPVIFDVNQRNHLDLEMAHLLEQFPRFPLLTLTFMLVRFHTQEKDVSTIFSMIKIICQRFGENHINREAVLSAFKQLGHSYYLLKSFLPTEWNASLLFRYFTDATSFQSLNTTFLSLIYITELAFDTHVLQIYTNGHYKNKIFNLGRIISRENDSSNGGKIMTYEAAIWITNYLQKPMGREVLRNVITIMFECLMVEKKALPVIQQWLTYRNDNNFRKFAQYAALQLFIEHSNLPHLIDIINEMFPDGDKFNLNSLIEHIFNSRVDDFTILHQILIVWLKNPCYSSDISIWISRQNVFDSILNFELQRITQNVNKSSQLPLKSFLSIIKGCSYDLQVKLKKHLQIFVEQKSDKDYILKEQYVGNILKWIIESKIWNKKYSKDLYEYLFSFFHHQSPHSVQKAILNGLYSVVLDSDWRNKGHILLTENTIVRLGTIISSYNKYSEDVLAVCLLVYGIYLRKLKPFDITYSIPDEITRALTTLFTLSSSTKVISSRAGLCLIIDEQSSKDSIEIPQLFKEKWNLKDENEYDMLLQETLFETNDRIAGEGSRIAYYISSHSATCLDKFVHELKDDLDHRYNNYVSSDPSPNYVRIASEFSEEDFQKFQNALQTDSDNETTLKKKLYDYAYNAKTTTDYKIAVELYGKFGILTETLWQMLELAEIRYASYIPIFLWDIKDVLDREVIEMLFEKLKLCAENEKFKFGSFILRLLIQLANTDVVSKFEVHQKISDIINKFSHNHRNSDRLSEGFIFDQLLGFDSVIKTHERFSIYGEKVELFSRFLICSTECEVIIKENLCNVRFDIYDVNHTSTIDYIEKVGNNFHYLPFNEYDCMKPSQSISLFICL